MKLKTSGETVTKCLKEHQRKIATLFFDNQDAVFICTPGTHYNQKETYTETVINNRRLEQGLPSIVNIDEKIELWSNCTVDLIIADGFLYIRPETNRMDLSMKADEVLQKELGNDVPKQFIRFMFANLEEIKKALRTAGEYWRISPYPRMEDEIKAEITSSRIAINGDAIYYYSSPTGTRYITCEKFENLSLKDDHYLRRHLIEIRDYSKKSNASGHREVAFFGALKSFSSENLKGLDFEKASSSELRTSHSELLAEFKAATDPAFHHDDSEDNNWRNHMIASLIDSKNNAIADELVEILPPEFFRMIRWLPCGRFRDREFIFDSLFAQEPDRKSAEELDNLQDERVKGFIGNYICEFGLIEYINIGRVMPSIRKKGKRDNGHRVYLAEIKLPGVPQPVLRILRVLQFGMRERLDKGADMLTAYQESIEYVDYTKQRRLACGELGMPLPGRIDIKIIREEYDGLNADYHGEDIWTFYFERDFINGMATDKIPDEKLKDPEFCSHLATLLGQAAAPNMIVGRVDRKEKKVIFDGGDEVLLSDSEGYPARLVVADHAGTFFDYTSDLITFAKDYAEPVITRSAKVADAAEFKKVYLDSLKQRLLDLQEECKAQEDFFRVRFLHGKQGKDTFSDRWDKALTRLQETDIEILVETISMEIDKGS